MTVRDVDHGCIRRVLVYECITHTVAAPAELADWDSGCPGGALNPFDTRDIRLCGYLHQPQGDVRSVFGFADRDHRLDPRSDNPKAIEAAIGDGPLLFRIRVSPTTVGEHRLELWWQYGDGRRIALDDVRFMALFQPHAGHVRIGPNGYSFATEDGEPFYPIGSNICWPNMMGHFAGQKLHDIRLMLERLAGHGGTAYRLWANVPWAHAIDWTGKEQETPLRFGQINLSGCAKLDAIVAQSEALGLRIMFCIDAANNWAKGDLTGSPYAKANGGPCETTADYFNLPEARAMTREKMRYVAARWGYSPAIWCWEFWNEVDGCGLDAINPHQQLAWHQEMATVLRDADPYRHLITTSTGHPLNLQAMWRIPEIEISQTHHYGYKDSVVHISDILPGYHRENTAMYRKPHIASELGVCFASDQSDWETNGCTLHNALWSSALLPKTCGPGFLWFWDGYIHRYDLYDHYRGIAAFLAEERWHEQETVPIEIICEGVPPRAFATPQEMKVPTTLSGSDYYRSAFNLDREGLLPDLHLIPNTWYGSERPGCQFRARFQVDFPQDGQFIPMVWGGSDMTNGIVSESASASGQPIAEIRVDGKIALCRPVVVTRREGSTDFYCDRLAIDVPAGRHEIALTNIGQGAFVTGHILLTHYQTTDRRVSAQGLRCGNRLAFWIRNRADQWQTFQSGTAIEPVDGLRITLCGLPVGTYEVQWWDTRKGTIIRRECLDATVEGRVTVSAPRFIHDLAAKLVNKQKREC